MIGVDGCVTQQTNGRDVAFIAEVEVEIETFSAAHQAIGVVEEGRRAARVPEYHIAVV